MITFKGRHTPKPIILQCVRWHCSFALSYRNIEEIMAERGLKIDHSTLNRRVVHYAPKLEKAFHKKKKRPGDRWRMDETYLKVREQWRYYYRAVDKEGNTIDFLLKAKRETQAAQSILAGIELVAMLKKGQMKNNMVGALSPAEQFYALAA